MSGFGVALAQAAAIIGTMINSVYGEVSVNTGPASFGDSYSLNVTT